MGLPVWRAPSPEESKDAIKVDLTASSRSTIRRRSQRSPAVPRRARRSANPHAAPATAPYSRSPRRGEFGFRLSPGFDFDSLGQSAAPRDRDQTPLPPVPESRNYTRDARNRADVHRFRRAHDDAAYRGAAFAGPPHYFGLSEERDSLDSVHGLQSAGSRGYDRGELPSYTPNFAPAAYSPSGFTALPPLRRSRTPPSAARPRSRQELVAIDSDEEANDANPVGFPPLRRMGRRTIADGPLPSSSLRESWSPATTVDGLGDRERSFSPIDDHWDTMLTTVAPDPHLPSADSSFTSAAASASFSASHPSSRAASSNSNSASSSRTHLTIPSTYSPEIVTGVFCESSDDDSGASDTEVSDASSLAAAHISSAAPARNPSRYSRGLRDRSDDSRRFVRNFYSFTSRAGTHTHHPYHHHHHHTHDAASSVPLPSSVDGPLLDSEPQPREPRLEHLRGILRDLTDRDDVPEEFWISTGLRLERLEHERDRLVREGESLRLRERDARL